MTTSTPNTPVPDAAPTTEPAWAAPTATARLDATVEVPGSKSLTNRYLVLAALADGPSELRGALSSRDTLLMAQALRQLGVGIEIDGTTWQVTPGDLRGPASIDCGLAGTVMRFLPAVAALADGPVHFDGDAGARVRPMGPVLAGLRSLGVPVTGPDGTEPTTLPFTVEGRGGVVGGPVDVDASASSQFVSGLLLAGARFDRGLRLRHVGTALPSLPHIEMTVDVLRGAGVEVDDSTPATWAVAPGPIVARDVRVEPDLSNASPFLAAALVAGGTVRVSGWPASTTRPGALVPELLEQLGARTRRVGDTLEVTGTGRVRGIDVDLHAAGELTPTIAALAALAETPSRLRGVAHLRGHETDRLAALVTEINRLGGRATETEDGLTIEPATLHGGTVETYHDHRMATFGAILGLRVPDVHVVDVATTSKTLPDFTRMWDDMLAATAQG